MEIQRKIMAREEDRLNDLPESILLHILSKLWDRKEVVRTSVLSTRWKFLWMSVPVSLNFYFPRGSSAIDIPDFLASINRELYYWSQSCNKIRLFKVILPRYDKSYVKDVDLWVHFATKVANVVDFTLGFSCESGPKYEFPQFAYKNTSLISLILFKCQLNPSGSVNWGNLTFLSIASLNLTDSMLEKVLSGCPNLETLDLDNVVGIQRLEFSSVKLTSLSLKDLQNENPDVCFELVAPHIQYLELISFCDEIHLQQRNVASLVKVDLLVEIDDIDEEERDLEKECGYLKELLHNVTHVENLELGPRCIQPILELKGWQSPPSSRKFLKLHSALEWLDFPGICIFLQSSPDLEALVIDWYNYKQRDLLSRYTNEDEQSRRFETHNFNCSLLHLRTIKIIDYHEPLSGTKFLPSVVKYFLKNATVLEKLVIAAKEGSDVSQDYVKMDQEFLSFPRSSPHASVVFSY